MLDKKFIRAMAEAERMMDSGELPFVWAPSSEGTLERLASSKEVMEDLNLVSGQTVNSIIRNAILTANLENLGRKLDKIAQDIEDKQLDSDFDFRSMM